MDWRETIQGTATAGSTEARTPQSTFEPSEWNLMLTSGPGTETDFWSQGSVPESLISMPSEPTMAR